MIRGAALAGFGPDIADEDEDLGNPGSHPVIASVAVESIGAAALADHAAILGHLLAGGHARTRGASMIVGYVGSSDRLDVALARFARLYADQTEADHAALVKAADRGIVPIERGL